jgi:hypothetical protein
MPMKLLIIVLVFLFSTYSTAEECSPEKVNKLKQMIDSNALGKKDVKYGKLVKFTHHDYSIACNIKLSSGKYKWFTDNNETRFIIEKKTENLSDYYGLFK